VPSSRRVCCAQLATRSARLGPDRRRGLLLGVAEQMFDLYVSSNYEILAALILVLLVLAVRPSGLFGRTAVREV
jgi:hypothetical protein